eukprot:COSAG05_NODE_21883_length_268_cov_1.218935_1_plen_30_part_10
MLVDFEIHHMPAMPSGVLYQVLHVVLSIVP